MKKVLILGRPNVGKSSLFNRLIRKKKALVINQPGVTRDILKAPALWWGKEFEVWDSGGLWMNTPQWNKSIQLQVEGAALKADLLILVMDGRAGLADEDKQTLQLVKKSSKPFLVLINKVDDLKQTDLFLSDFYRLGVDILPCAFEKDKGIAEIVEWILPHCRKSPSSVPSHAPASKNLCVFVIGKTNAGKSTLCNALLKQERMISSPQAGTTTDVVEETLVFKDQSLTLCDTAGLRKASTLKDKTEDLSLFKTHQSFKQAHLTWLLMDASQSGPSRQEARLLKMCIEQHKTVLLVVSKWDKVSKTTTKNQMRKQIQETFHFYPDLPVVFTSALNRQGLNTLLNTSCRIYTQMGLRISTAVLNRFFNRIIRTSPAPVYGSKDVKFYYLTQKHGKPPSFIVFANYPEGVRPAYRRFLIRSIQKQWNLQGIPIRINIIKNRA